VGVLIILATIIVHTATVLLAIRIVGPRLANKLGRKPIQHLSAVMTLTVLLLMSAHMIEVGLWGTALAVLRAVEPRDASFYFAFVSYTTLGYGDVLASSSWRLLGPMAAMNGILLFGWSTAVIFQVMYEATKKGPAELN
jgi:polyferredoxin